MSVLPIGSLVISDSFDGIGKVTNVDIDANRATVAFLSPPCNLSPGTLILVWIS